MECTTTIDIAAPPGVVFALAADIEGWPRLLPHYRWVRRRDGPRDAEGYTVEMAAWRRFPPTRLAYPVRWTAEVTTLTDPYRIRFRHIHGPTRGMIVEWRLTPTATGTHVAIWHRFHSSIPLVGPLFAEYIAGRLFIQYIAGKTLRWMRRHAEARARAVGSSA